MPARYPYDPAYAAECSKRSDKWTDQYPSLYNKHGGVQRSISGYKDVECRRVMVSISRFDDGTDISCINGCVTTGKRELTPAEIDVLDDMLQHLDW